MDVKGTLMPGGEPLGSRIYLGAMLCSVTQLKLADVPCSGVQIIPQAGGGNQVWDNPLYLVDFVWLVFFLVKNHTNNFSKISLGAGGFHTIS